MLNLFINNQNIMKHTQLILAAALVALAGCSKENIDLNGQNSLDNEIGFTAVTRKATKANNAIITGTTYTTDNTFKVWGWQSQEGDFSEFDSNTASNFMSNLTIEWTKGANKNVEGDTHALAWRNDDHYYYWPFTGALGFLAIHPSDLAAATYTALTPAWDKDHDKAMATITGYTISEANNNKTVDLMFASKEGTRESIAKVGDGKVAMVFKHALSQIVVKAKTDDDYTADVQFDLNSVQFNNIDLSGDVSYANEGISWSSNTTYNSNWVYYNTVKQNILKSYDTADEFIYGSAILMIPQPGYKHVDQVGESGDPDYVAPVEGTTLTIGYSMQQKPLDSNPKITGTVTIPAPWAKVKEGETTYNEPQAISGWEAGKKYVYTLNFKLNEILFNPSVIDWIEVELTTIDI